MYENERIRRRLLILRVIVRCALWSEKYGGLCHHQCAEGFLQQKLLGEGDYPAKELEPFVICKHGAEVVYLNFINCGSRNSKFI